MDSLLRPGVSFKASAGVTFMARDYRPPTGWRVASFSRLGSVHARRLKVTDELEHSGRFLTLRLPVREPGHGGCGESQRAQMSLKGPSGRCNHSQLSMPWVLIAPFLNTSSPCQRFRRSISSYVSFFFIKPSMEVYSVPSVTGQRFSLISCTSLGGQDGGSLKFTSKAVSQVVKSFNEPTTSKWPVLFPPAVWCCRVYGACVQVIDQ